MLGDRPPTYSSDCLHPDFLLVTGFHKSFSSSSEYQPGSLGCFSRGVEVTFLSLRWGWSGTVIFAMSLLVMADHFVRCCLGCPPESSLSEENWSTVVLACYVWHWLLSLIVFPLLFFFIFLDSFVMLAGCFRPLTRFQSWSLLDMFLQLLERLW